MLPSLNDVVTDLEAGRLPQAEEHCRQILSAEPENSSACHLLGVIAGRKGDHEVAADLMRKSVEMAPDNVVFRSNLSRALLHLDQLDEAEAVLREALRLQPAAPQLHLTMGTIKSNQGNPSEAISCFEEALRLQPNFAVAQFNLGEVHRRLGDADAAIAHFKKTLELDPNYVDARQNLAGVLVDRGDFIDAILCIQGILQLQPRSAQAYCNLGVALRAAGDVDQAIVAYRNSIQLDPQAPIPRFDLAMLQIAMGDLDEAEACLKVLKDLNQVDPRIVVGEARLLERRGKIEEAAELLKPIYEQHSLLPSVAGAYALVQEQLGQYEEAAASLQHVIDSKQTAAIDGISIRFHIGKLYDALQRYDEAFENYRIGNENRKKAFPVAFEVEQCVEELRQLSAVYSADRIKAYPRASVSSDLPIFILGMPRSGTSLVEQILASHPLVYGAGEQTEIREMIRATYQSAAEQEKAKRTGLQINRRESASSSVIPAGMESITTEQLDQMAGRYLDRLRSLSDAERITDKMPYNFLYIGLIRLMFPNAPIIHCCRHPLDTCLSCYFQNFFLGNQITFDLTDLGVFYRHYMQVMEHWRATDEMSVLDVQYEQLTDDPEPLTRRILEYCDLPWDDRCLRFHESKRLVHTASYQQVRKPIYKTSVGRWKHYRSHLQPLIEALEFDEAQLS